MELCPPQAIVPENISSTFNRLRELAFPALMDNIQSHTEGLNQVCILDTDSREALVLIMHYIAMIFNSLFYKAYFLFYII